MGICEHRRPVDGPLETSRLRRYVAGGDAAQRREIAMDDMDERERKLPEFERDDERTVGGGLISQGGTATDRGPGELDGTAQGGETDADERGTTTEAPADHVATAGR